MSHPLRSYQGSAPALGERVMVDPSSVIIGDVDLADDVSIWPLVAIRGDVNNVVIGCRTNIITRATTRKGFPSLLVRT